MAVGFQVLVPDARNHGRSPHTHYMDYSLMSEDIQLLMRREGISQAAIVGHSMGGRTAMALALNKNSAVERLVVVDVAPTRMEAGTFSPEYRQATRRATLKGTSLSTIKHAQEVERILETPSNFPEYVKALLQVRFDGEPTLLEARRSASDQIAWAVENELIRAFLVTNVTEENGIYGWKCNLKAIAANLNHITAFTSFNQQYSGDTLFIGGGNSAYFTKADYPEVYRLFPRAQIVNIDGAGHWVHYDKPHEFMQHLISFLNAPSDQLQST
ncbi:PREDICTED: alpha/beta hydrolase domain-containing protein 11-like isoform X2 [Priapulus caudatus]|uniref:sn-1-specific diacylglycerol lipase ABHD11 n=1 Tax=Priapulus caudatus TaxID=37621 RepID=A0ABM1DR52_PRICU|nr:PREDICTED: alpha/beta hydrolase domain-containing protein 11-like isoform X2 [Priapulus caudatus]